MTYASPVDYQAYGHYGPGRGFDSGQSFSRPRYRFQGRILPGGDYPAEPGRYHLYIALGCPWAQRTAIVRKLKALEDIVSLSFVDDVRDGRGWAFREHRGPDPVNGFAFLSEAYEATLPGYDGHVSVPVLWDRSARRIVSNNFPDITIDLGGQFERWADTSIDLYPAYPAALRAEIDALNERVYQTVNNGTYQVAGATTEDDYQRLRGLLLDTFAYLDARLGERRFLFGPHITEADVRLWPTLARFDLSYNPLGKISERPLTSYANLWGYARDLYQHPAFRDTTDFSSFSELASGPAPSFVNDAPWRIPVTPHRPDWTAPHHRA